MIIFVSANKPAGAANKKDTMAQEHNDALFIHFLGVLGSLQQPMAFTPGMLSPRFVVEERILPMSLNLLPELVKTVRMEQNHHHHLDVFDHTVLVVENTAPQPMLRLAALFHDLGKVATRKVEDDGRVTFHGHEDESAKIALRVLDFEPEKAQLVAWLCARHMDLKIAGPDGMGISDKSLGKLIQRAPDPRMIEVLLQLCHADNIAHAPASCMPDQIGVIRQRVVEVTRKLEEKQKQHDLTEVVNGGDLIALQPGRHPGPWVRNMLEAVTSAERMGLLETKEQMLHFALRRFEQGA